MGTLVPCDAQRRDQRQAREVVNEKVMAAFVCPLHLEFDTVN
jgi:hypothetical protein